MSPRLSLTAAVVLAASVFVLMLGASTAGAHHAAESMTVSQTTGLDEGAVVRVTVSGFTPNAKPVKLVIAGQGELVTIPDKLNFDEYAVAPEVVIGPDGTGSADFSLTSDHGVVQDGSTLDCYVSQCWVVAVQEPFLPQPNYDSEAIFFAAGSLTPTPTAAAEVPATVPPVAEVPTTVAPTTAPPTTAATTTTAPTTTTTTKVDTSEIAASSAKDDGGGGGSGPILAIIAVVVVAVGAGGYFLTRKKKDSIPV